MLQFADVLREERVQMKLSEARYQFEEKNAVFEKLRSELETFLKNRGENSDISPLLQKIKDLGSYLNRSRLGSESVEKKDDIGVGEQEKPGNESDDSDLHSIELSLDNNKRSFKWSYACDNDAGFEVKRVFIGAGCNRIVNNVSWGASDLVSFGAQNAVSIFCPKVSIYLLSFVKLLL